MKKIFLGIFIVFVVFAAVIFHPFFRSGRNTRTIIIGIDGMDPAMTQGLISDGKMPNAKYLIENGSFGMHNAFDIVDGEITSPVIWTSVATGVRPDKHGIKNSLLKSQMFSGNMKEFFALSSFRKVPALWNIFSDYGEKVGVVNWWITYPAEAINGFMITNVANEILWQIGKKFFSRPAIDSLTGAVYPGNLLKDIDGYRRVNLGRLSCGKGMENMILGKAPDNDFTCDLDYKEMRFKVNSLVEYAYITDRNSLLFVKYLMEKHPDLNLIMGYFEGIDILSHMFFGFRGTKARNLFPEKYELYSQIIRNYYMLMDAYLGEILSYIRENDILIICSDHGFEQRPDFEQQLQNGNIRTGQHNPEGVFVIYGKYIKRHNQLAQVSLLDIVPTVLYLNGMEVPKYCDGTVLKQCLNKDILVKKRKLRIKSFGFRNRNLKKEKSVYPFEKDMRDRLTSLGYLN